MSQKSISSLNPLELGAVVGVHVGRHPQGLEHLLHARRGGRKTAPKAFMSAKLL